MDFTFTQSDIDSISGILNSAPQPMENSWSWRMHNQQTGQSLVLVVYNAIKLGKDQTGSLISIQTKHGYFELHNCAGYLLFEPDEVIFVEVKKETASCLTIGRECTCSMYANINRQLLSQDITSLDAPAIMAAMQLSLTEGLMTDIES